MQLDLPGLNVLERELYNVQWSETGKHRICLTGGRVDADTRASVGSRQHINLFTLYVRT